MTRLAKGLSLAAAVVLVSSGSAGAGGGVRRTPSYRPYITEVGPPLAINRERLDKEMVLNSDLRSWIKDYGYPDVAELQEVVPEYGWTSYEVRTFYIDRNQELAFGRVSFFPVQRDSSFLDDYGLIKYQGPLQAENIARIETEVRVNRCRDGGSSLDRILAAAERAERAATQAEKESLRAANAAARAESTVARMETGFAKSLRK